MFSEKIHRYIFLFGIFSLGFGMMLGAIPTSIPQIILLANWLLEGRFKFKWQQLRSNKIFWLLSSVLFIHVLAMLYTSYLSAGIDDLRIKMPFFFLALIFFSTSPLSQKEIHGFLWCFLFGCVCNTVWCLLYSFILHHNETGRDASRFMSHIRLGLYLNMAIASCIYFFVKASGNTQKFFYIFLGIYFLLILFILGLASGLSDFFILSFFGLCALVFSQRATIKIISVLVLLVFAVISINYVKQVKDEQLKVRSAINNTLLHHSQSNHGYIHLDTLFKQRENGNYVMINIQLEELKREWQRRFPEDSFSYSPKEHNMNRFNILVRYLASKGLNKDSAGIAQLNTDDVANIKKEIGNYKYSHWNFLHKRVYELVNEYDEFVYHRSINGHSLTMRVYFWKAALHVIKQHILFGVGTGDVQSQLNKAYEETHSPLQPEWHKRPHNQFLAITVACGIVGLFILVLSIIYPIIYLRKYLPVLFWPFLIIALISFLMEDTLESQAGVTFYVVFNTLFLSIAWFRKKEIRTQQNPAD